MPFLEGFRTSGRGSPRIIRALSVFEFNIPDEAPITCALAARDPSAAWERADNLPRKIIFHCPPEYPGMGAVSARGTPAELGEIAVIPGPGVGVCAEQWQWV